MVKKTLEGNYAYDKFMESMQIYIRNFIEESLNKKHPRFLNKLSQQVLENICIDYRIQPHITSYDNPISFYIGFGRLNEGLIHTYPIDKTISYVTNHFQLSEGQIFEATNQNNIKVICVWIPDIGQNIEYMTRALNCCGYFLSCQEKNYDKWILLQFEPKHQENISDSLREKEDILYHLTPSYNLKKIKAIGLSPKSKNDVFDYPNRIYFFRGSIPQMELLSIGERLCNTNNSEGNERKYCLLTIDLNSIHENVKFFEDCNYPNAVYTISNISKNAIIDIKEIDFN